jgi:hypothetical protein
MEFEYSLTSSKEPASGQYREPRRRGNVSRWSHYQATASDKSEEFMCAVVTVIFGVTQWDCSSYL